MNTERVLRLNWRKGFFRVWIVGAVAWTAFVITHASMLPWERYPTEQNFKWIAPVCIGKGEPGLQGFLEELAREQSCTTAYTGTEDGKAERRAQLQQAQRWWWWDSAAASASVFLVPVFVLVGLLVISKIVSWIVAGFRPK
jgi:hypothetical protein